MRILHITFELPFVNINLFMLWWMVMAWEVRYFPLETLNFLSKFSVLMRCHWNKYTWLVQFLIGSSLMMKICGWTGWHTVFNHTFFKRLLLLLGLHCLQYTCKKAALNILPCNKGSPPNAFYDYFFIGFVVSGDAFQIINASVLYVFLPYCAQLL